MALNAIQADKSPKNKTEHVLNKTGEKSWILFLLILWHYKAKQISHAQPGHTDLHAGARRDFKNAKTSMRGS